MKLIAYKCSSQSKDQVIINYESISNNKSVQVNIRRQTKLTKLWMENSYQIKKTYKKSSCTLDKDILDFTLGKKILSYPCYLTQDVR